MTKLFSHISVLAMLLFLIAVSGLGDAVPAFAEDRFGEDGQGHAYSGVKNGRLKSLSSILKLAKGKVKGRVTNVKLISRSGKQVYRVKILKSNGHLVSVYLDAQTSSRKRKVKRRSISSRGRGRRGGRSLSGSDNSGSNRSARSDDGFGDQDEDSSGRGRGRHRGRGGN